MSAYPRTGPVRADGEPVFGMEVCSDAVRCWVALSGELDLASAPHLQQVLDQFCRDGYSEIVLDLSGLEFLSAAGLEVFHRANDHLRAAGGRLILHRPGRMARRVLAITELDTVLTIWPATTPSVDHQREPERCPDPLTPVLAAVWCRSVGTSWTLELHRLSRGTTSLTLVDWISSGVPISQPEPPEALARELLAQRGLQLFYDSSAGPCTGSRRGIGYAAGDAELITLAHLIQDTTTTGLHPVMLAAQWVAAGFSADAAGRWIRQGVHSPQAAQHQTAPIGHHQHNRPQRPHLTSAGSAIAGESTAGSVPRSAGCPT